MAATAVRWRLAAIGLLAAGVTVAINLAGRLIYGKLPVGRSSSSPWRTRSTAR
jgi:hypothetical protein